VQLRRTFARSLFGETPNSRLAHRARDCGEENPTAVATLLIDAGVPGRMKRAIAAAMHRRRTSRAVSPVQTRNALFNVERATPQSRATDNTVRAGAVCSIARAASTTSIGS